MMSLPAVASARPHSACGPALRPRSLTAGTVSCLLQPHMIHSTHMHSAFLATTLCAFGKDDVTPCCCFRPPTQRLWASTSPSVFDCGYCELPPATSHDPLHSYALRLPRYNLVCLRKR